MLGFLTGRVKTWALAALAAALPIIYVLGRKDGRHVSKAQQLKEAAETNDERADFYKRMSDFPNDDERFTRHDLVERLRSGRF